jgi:2-succinyl-5-enolpyruvyl-6-hydroxy-3-cyclohexene-1-carboxylate synthase
MKNSHLFPDPDVVLRFGDLPTSKFLNDYLNQIQPKYRIHFAGDGVWADDSHRTTHLMVVDEKLAIMQIMSRFEPRYTTAWSKHFFHIDEQTWQVINEELPKLPLFDGRVVWEVVNAMPSDSHLIMGNSLPVRHLDQFGKHSMKKLRAYANRGVSGIDGNISTALGIAQHTQQPTATVVGDLTLYHDMNGLMAIQRLGIPLTIVVVNNHGGGIFHRLPIKDYEPTFTDLFITPHTLDFSHTAKLYGLDYVHAEDSTTLQHAVKESLEKRQAILIEVTTDSKTDLVHRRAIIEAVNTRIQTMVFDESTEEILIS